MEGPPAQMGLGQEVSAEPDTGPAMGPDGRGQCPGQGLAGRGSAGHSLPREATALQCQLSHDPQRGAPRQGKGDRELCLGLGLRAESLVILSGVSCGPACCL